MKNFLSPEAGTVLLCGVVGSRAYGFSTPTSDTDRRGVFAAPNEAVLGLLPLPESRNTSSPDIAFSELRKFVHLLHQSNPTAMEVLWLPEYEVVHPVGRALIDARASFLASESARQAYIGSAMAQYGRLAHHADKRGGIDARGHKYVRHIFRFLEQGRRLLAEGSLEVRVEDPSWYLEEIPQMDLRQVRQEIDRQAAAIVSITAVIPAKSDFALADNLLVTLRRALLEA